MENVKIRLSDQFRALALECEQEVLTMRELVTALGVRGHAFVVLIFTVPFLLPIPLPGLSVVFGIPVLISGLGISFNFKLWLPARIMRQSLPGHLLARVFRAGAGLMTRLEKLMRPRMFGISESPQLRVLAGLLIAFSGLLLALPLPPGTNFPPAGVCVFFALGILERDGLFFILGFLAFILNISVFVGLVIFARPWLLRFFNSFLELEIVRSLIGGSS